MTASASADTFKGDSIELLNIDFEITDGTTNGMAILYAENAYMTNIGSGFIVERQGIWIDDCETNQLIGRAFLRRENPGKMILFQSHSSPKYAVLKPDGDKRKASVSGTVVYSNYGSGNVAITGSALQCSTENNGFMIVGCGSIFPAGATPVGDANALQFVDDFFVVGVSPGKMSVAASLCCWHASSPVGVLSNVADGRRQR